MGWICDMPTVVNLQSDLRQDPSKLMVGDSHHYRNLQHLLPAEQRLCSVVQEVIVHNGSQEDFHLKTRHILHTEQLLRGKQRHW